MDGQFAAQERLSCMAKDNEIYVVANMVDYKVQKLNNIEITRKCSLRGYILGVLTHTTAWEVVKHLPNILICVAKLYLAS